MEELNSQEPDKAGEQPKPEAQLGKNENDPEAIANRVVDVFWKSLRAGQEDDS